MSAPLEVGTALAGGGRIVAVSPPLTPAGTTHHVLYVSHTAQLAVATLDTSDPYRELNQVRPLGADLIAAIREYEYRCSGSRVDRGYLATRTTTPPVSSDAAPPIERPTSDARTSHPDAEASPVSIDNAPASGATGSREHAA